MSGEFAILTAPMKLMVLTCALCVAAHSQIHGSVVAYQVYSDGFFIAADSRGVGSNGISDNNQCKITALGLNTVFAAVGFTAFTGRSDDHDSGWDVHQEARIAATIAGITLGTPFDQAQEAATRVADRWASLMETRWVVMNFWQPQRVADDNKRGNGSLVTGLFAVGKGGKIAVTMRTIKLQDGLIVSDAQFLDNVGGVIGRVEVANELAAKKSQWAKEENLPTSPLPWVVRMVELTIAHDKSGEVGGPIDALQLSLDGHITWFGRKKQCG